ncbi:uncharacterized protein B0H18DRAFT_137583 [Fomitopsis serialis]|uniref:uncharacterized protein n=1 Tax=Fomitopsis serialis TaxID=139415 RepID=UPI002008568F|nr:uncharacterized protein B0H18DRAFT_137583 [Neoantrodia serialis]KAH9914330.1 hypothetical protein B0H18DRAFT_137583 [Neoantrodia serialis]
MSPMDSSRDGTREQEKQLLLGLPQKACRRETHSTVGVKANRGSTFVGVHGLRQILSRARLEVIAQHALCTYRGRAHQYHREDISRRRFLSTIETRHHHSQMFGVVPCSYTDHSEGRPLAGDDCTVASEMAVPSSSWSEGRTVSTSSDLRMVGSYE